MYRRPLMKPGILVIWAICSVLYQALNSSSRSGGTCNHTANKPIGRVVSIADPPLGSPHPGPRPAGQGTSCGVIGVLFDVAFGQIAPPHSGRGAADPQIDADFHLRLPE